MASTQDHLPIADARDDFAILKDGGMAIILQTTAVNFGLLSEREQLAIIGSFAATLNSLSFSIQIVVRSKRLDVSTYLDNLREAQKKQKNVLLANMMQGYRAFIERTVQENDVLDKQFYIVIPLSHIELGITKNVEGHLAKAATILLPRRDHIIRQLARTGVKANQLTSEQIVKLFYDYYNPPAEELAETKAIAKLAEEDKARREAAIEQTQVQQDIPLAPVSQPSPVPQVQQPIAQPQTTSPKASSEPQRAAKLSASYVVEELPDEYGAVT